MNDSCDYTIKLYSRHLNNPGSTMAKNERTLLLDRVAFYYRQSVFSRKYFIIFSQKEANDMFLITF